MGGYSVEGKDRGTITLYGLSTCVWCKKTRELLNELGVAYRFVEVDRLEREERDETLAEVKRWNPRCSFPSIVINAARCIVGFDEAQIKAAVGE